MSCTGSASNQLKGGMANHHLVILKKPYLDAILAGRKTIESRFLKTRHSPFGRVAAGDRLFLKVSSGPVCATAVVAAAENFENLTPKQIAAIKEKHNCQICGSDEYWQNIADCRFGILAWLKDVKTIKPVYISKKDWRGWVVLTDKKNFGLLKSNIAEKI
jgi:ASC-1-like (ASCH) protein